MRLKNSSANLDIVEELLQCCLGRFSKLYIVIDSLDDFEKEHRSVLLKCLSSLTSVPGCKIRLLLVGRSSAFLDIQRWFQSYQEKSADCQEGLPNIESYIRGIIPSLSKELFVEDAALYDELIKALTEGANGMCVLIQILYRRGFANYSGRFLWADYQIKDVSECTCEDEIREVLRTLPKDLGETFNRILKRINKRKSADTARQIFRWVAAVKRPLLLDELREALSYEPGKPDSIPGKRPIGIERVAAWCENLVQLDDEFETVQFAHSSVLQHLMEEPSDPSLQNFHIELGEVDHFVGEICVTYLDSNYLKTDLTRPLPSIPIPIPNRLPSHVVKSAIESNRFTKHLTSVLQKASTPKLSSSTDDGKTSIRIQAVNEDSKSALQLGHPFLAYATEYWLFHTRDFSFGNSITWQVCNQMIQGLHHVAETPWTHSEFRDQDSDVLEWAERYGHFALLNRLISANSTLR